MRARCSVVQYKQETTVTGEREDSDAGNRRYFSFQLFN